MHLHIPAEFDIGPLVEALSRSAREQGYLIKGQIAGGETTVVFMPAGRGHAYVDLLGQTRYAEPDLQAPPPVAHPNVLKFPRRHANPARTSLHNGPQAA